MTELQGWIIIGLLSLYVFKDVRLLDARAMAELRMPSSSARDLPALPAGFT